MLSKLEFFQASGPVSESQGDRRALQEALERYFRLSGQSARVIPAPGGTLGVCFHLKVGGARRFLKTHLAGDQARANLAKEGEILLQLYGEAVVLDRIEVQPEGAAARLCLMMAELSHLPAPMATDDAAAMVRSYTERLGRYRPAHLTAGRDFEHYLAHGRWATAALEDRGLIGRQMVAELEQHLERLRRELAALPRTLCHGDLGPRNIMTDGAQLVAIDWEDAFWGIARYDYLYWLTFMENRPFLRSAAFGRTGLDPAVEHAILALVVLLKCHLSVRSGAYLQNAVPIGARLAEVLALRQGA